MSFCKGTVVWILVAQALCLNDNGNKLVTHHQTGSQINITPLKKKITSKHCKKLTNIAVYIYLSFKTHT